MVYHDILGNHNTLECPELLEGKKNQIKMIIFNLVFILFPSPKAPGLSKNARFEPKWA